jgi:hypothetical protein
VSQTRSLDCGGGELPLGARDDPERARPVSYRGDRQEGSAESVRSEAAEVHGSMDGGAASTHQHVPPPGYETMWGLATSYQELFSDHPGQV